MTVATPGNRHSISITMIRTAILVIAIGIVACVAYKAARASMTHDESSTFLNLVDDRSLNLWTCYRNPDCWTTANNHLLNTLLMRWTSSVFGPSEIPLRLPNLMMFLVYVACVVLLLRDTARNLSQAFFGVTLFLCNPFVLDFFALARGYGMGLGFMMLSLFAMWRYYFTGKSGYFVVSFLTATISVFANLTYVAYVMALTGAVLSLVVGMMLRRPRRQVSGLIPLSVAFCLIFLAVYFYRPVLILIGLGEFEYGAATLWESWTGFMRDSLYGFNWFGGSTVFIASAGGALLTLIATTAPWLPTQNPDPVKKLRFDRFLSILWIALILFLVVSHFWTGSYYPSGRKSIIFYPCAALLLYMLVHRFFRNQRIWSQLLMSFTGLLFLVHFIRTFNSRTYREWWYDASTKEMTWHVAAKAAGGTKVPLGVEWIFHPSTQFYVQTKRLPIDLAPYAKEVLKENPVQYYYVHPEHVPSLEPEFEIEKNFDGRLLLKRIQGAGEQYQLNQ